MLAVEETKSSEVKWMESIPLSAIPAEGPVANMAARYAAQIRSETGHECSCVFFETAKEYISSNISPHLCMIEICKNDIKNSQIIFMGVEMHKISGLWKLFQSINEVFSEELVNERIKSLSEICKDKTPKFHLTIPPYPGRAHVKIFRGAFPFFNTHCDVSHIAVVAQKKDDWNKSRGC